MSAKRETVFAYAPGQMPERGNPYAESFGVHVVNKAERSVLIAVVAAPGTTEHTSCKPAERAVALFGDAVLSSMREHPTSRLEDQVSHALSIVLQGQRFAIERATDKATAFGTSLCAVVGVDADMVAVKVGGGNVIAGPPWRAVFPPAHADTVGRFVFTDPHSIERACVVRLEKPCDTFLVFTDGIEPDLIHPGTTVIDTPLPDMVSRELAKEAVWGGHCSRASETLQYRLCALEGRAGPALRTVVAGHRTERPQ